MKLGLLTLTGHLKSKSLPIMAFVCMLIGLSILSSSIVHSSPATGTEYWAVIVGVSDYKDPSITDLNYCDDDANDIYNTLVSLHNWRKDHIIKLIDSKASKLDIINASLTIAYLDDSDDVFLFFFSGHGTFGSDLSPLDEADGFDEYICPWDTLPNSNENNIRDDEFEELLGYLDSSKKVVIMDTCYSGGFFKTTEMSTKTKPSVESVSLEDSFDKDLNKAGYIVLAACDDNELSSEYASLQNGVFTYYVVEGIGTAFPADSNSNGKVSAEEAFNYANPRVTEFNPDQHPQIYDGIAGEVELTLPLIGNAEVTRIKNLQYFELVSGNVGVTRSKNLLQFELAPNPTDITRIRNLQFFELKPNNADIARIRNLQFFEAKVLPRVLENITLNYFPEPFTIGSIINTTIIIGTSDPHGPSGTAHTLDTVGGMCLALKLGKNDNVANVRLYLDTDVAWYDGSVWKVYYWPVEGLTNVITVAGPGVNMITWRYFCNPWYAPVYMYYDGGLGEWVIVTPTATYKNSDWVGSAPLRDLVILEVTYVQEEDRYVLWVGGFGGYATRAGCLALQLSDTGQLPFTLQGRAMLIQWVDSNGNAKVDPEDTWNTIEIVP